MHVLALNAGSSSLKFALFQREGGQLSSCIRGSVDGLGSSMSHWTLESESGEQQETVEEVADHAAAFARIVSELREPAADIAAVGHRVVHGGARFGGPVRVDSAILDELQGLIPFAPLHQPVQLSLIERAHEQYPSVPQVACFDTAIHRTLPEIAARFPLPRWLWDEGIRRYGFHGLSYEFVLNSQPEFQQGRTIVAHLGNGASAAAFQDGVSVETTMGFTPTGGLMMGTRCGDLDPGVVLHLLREHHMSADDVDRLVNRESGLLGVSGTTSDLRSLLESQDDADARLAVEMFCYQAAKQIGGLVAALNGIDRLIFTGGIGEHSAEVRASICERLSYLGLFVDQDRNRANAAVVSRTNSRPAVHVVATDEEQVIARQTLDVLAKVHPSADLAEFPPRGRS